MAKKTPLKTPSFPVARLADIEGKILTIRGHRVMLDVSLAALYQVKTGQLNRAVLRNRDRFPADFMFQLTGPEAEHLKFQFGISKKARGGRRYLPYAFTEAGVAMLSSVLNSPRAVQVNIQIMRAFIRLRELALTHKDLQRKIEEMERKYDSQFAAVFQAMRELLEPAPGPGKVIEGFRPE